MVDRVDDGAQIGIGHCFPPPIPGASGRHSSSARISAADRPQSEFAAAFELVWIAIAGTALLRRDDGKTFGEVIAYRAG